MSIFGSESKFESSVKQIPYPQQAVYDNISDLRNLERTVYLRTRSAISPSMRIRWVLMYSPSVS